jgi:F0F1-type ATP synthase membrane subunit b/b'
VQQVIEDMKGVMDQRDKVFRESIHENARQVVHASSTLKDLSSHVLKLKQEINLIQEQASQQQTSQLEARLGSKLKELNSKLEALDKEKRSAERLSGQPIAEVVKQIQMLAVSLQKFEQENLTKIDQTHQQINQVQA